MKASKLHELNYQEFEAETLEEAIKKAKDSGLSDTEIRCWKVRKGGMAGFFARERYVAAKHDPQEVKIDPNTAEELVAKTSEWIEHINSAKNPDIGNVESFAVSATMPLRDLTDTSHLEDLIIDTKDELQCDKSKGINIEFDKMLAEATLITKQAIATGDTVSSASRTESLNRKRKSGELSELGIDKAMYPEVEDGSLDTLFSILSSIEIAKDPKVNQSAGSVAMVLKASSSVSNEQIAKMFEVDVDDVILAECDKLGMIQVAIRKKKRSLTICVVETRLENNLGEEIHAWMKDVNPSYVLGIIDAKAKEVDVLTWVKRIPAITSLALMDVQKTSTPAELIGKVPVAFLDGEPATPYQWMIACMRELAKRNAQQ